MKIRSEIRGHLAAIVTIFIWGITFISIKILLKYFSAFEILLFRLILAVCALFILRPPKNLFGNTNRIRFHDELPYMLAGLFGVTLYFIFQNLALEQTFAANVSVLISISPIFVALLSKIFFNKQLDKNFLLGFLISIIGIVIVTFNGRLELQLNPVGDLLSILAALAWAIYCILVRKIETEGKKVLALTRKVFTYGLVFLLFLIPVFGIPSGIDQLFNLTPILHLLFLGVIGSSLCFVSWNYAVHELGPVKTSVYLYAIPLVTIIASRITLNEEITTISLAGMALILIGMMFSENKNSRAKDTN